MMKSPKPRIVLVAVLVCLFAVGMSGLLNFFKYRSTVETIVKDRLVAIGNAVEGSIQSSLALGLQFADLAQLPTTMARERAGDDLILSIDVFDTVGSPLYSTDRLRGANKMPPEWLTEASRPGIDTWCVESSNESVAGITIQNNFGLTIGHLAMRYSNAPIRQAEQAVGRELAFIALGVFAVSATLAALALLAVKGRLTRDLVAVELLLRSAEPARLSLAVRKGPFGPALRRFFDTARAAESRIVALRGHLERGAQR